MAKDPENEIESLNRDGLNVEAMTPEELESVSGGIPPLEELPCDGYFTCGGTFNCSGTYSCTRTFGSEADPTHPNE